MNRIVVASLLTLMLSASSVLAHALEVEFTVDRKKREVAVKTFYETGDPPVKATARVRRNDGSILTEGKVDSKGLFVFRYEKPEALSVHVDAEGGHKGICLIKEADLGDSAATTPPATSEGSRFRDLMLGVGLVLATAAFLMSWRNSRRLKRLEELLERRT